MNSLQIFNKPFKVNIEMEIFLCLGASLSGTSKQTTKWVVFELNNCIPEHGEMLFSQTDQHMQVLLDL
jgi:hypothetical protein